MLNTLAVLLNNRRGELIGLVQRLYDERMKAHKNIVTVEAVTATELPDNVRQEVVTSLEEALNANVDLDERIDESLIAGMKVKIRNTVYDGSVAHQLERLRERLK